MKKQRRPYLKQKPILYFDENVPPPFIDHFRKNSWWKKKIKVLSAVELGNQGRSDEFHFHAYHRKYAFGAGVEAFFNHLSHSVQ